MLRLKNLQYLSLGGVPLHLRDDVVKAMPSRAISDIVGDCFGTQTVPRNDNDSALPAPTCTNRSHARSKS